MSDPTVFVTRFEQAWKDGKHPDIAAFLPSEPALRRAALIALVRIDFERRLKAGEPVRVESYLKRFPELSENRNLVLDLLAIEYRWRQRHESDLWSEYQKRFPQYTSALRQRLQQTIATDPEMTEAAVSPGGGNPIDCLAPPQAPDELGRLGTYRILKILGQGGMGVVYQAEDSRLKRTVALKVMLPGMVSDPNASKRFLREAQAMAAIDNDHIVRIYQVDEDHGIPFFAMELLRGESLDDRLKRDKLPLHEAVRIGREIAEALAAAHATGLVHRDIKPANIWLEQGPIARVKILDFGLARPVDERNRLTRTGLLVGTPAYMAPEQVAGVKVDHRCDLFSLGCVLYRLITGQLPFQGVDGTDTLLAVTKQTPTLPHVVDTTIPRSLSDLVMKLLAKVPNDRPASAQIVAEELQAIEKKWLDQVEQKAGPFAGKRWLLWVGAAVALIALLVLASCLSLGIYLATRGDRAKPLPPKHKPNAGVPVAARNLLA